MLKSRYRLRDKKEFQKIYKKGTKYRGIHGMLVALKVDSKDYPLTPKFGYVVSKKMGNAVQRNLLTRQLKDITIRVLKENENLFEGYLFSYIAYEKVNEFSELKTELTKLFDQFIKQK